MSAVAVRLLSLLCLAYAQPSPGCKDGFRYLDNNKTLDVASCSGKCIAKCCPAKQILLANDTVTTCVDSLSLSRTYGVIHPDDYSKSPIEIYNKDFKNKSVVTNKTLSDFTFIVSQRFREPDCSMRFLDIFQTANNKFYLSENGTFTVWTANELDPWNEFSTEEFCVEHLVTLRNGTLESKSPQVDFVTFMQLTENEKHNRAQFGLYVSLVSCFFLSLTMYVYIRVKEHEKLPGKMAIAFMGTLLATFLCRAVHVVANNYASLDSTACSVVSLLFMYALLSSFTWMIVFSFDFWRMLKAIGMTKHKPRRSAASKFRRCALIAWGAPLVPVLFIVIVEHLDLTHIPRFVKPHIIYDLKNCFFGEDERRLYFNIPISIAVLINIILFVMCSVKLFNITADTNMAVESSKTGTKKRNNFYLLLKLAGLMGISWIFEVISAEYRPDSLVWYISDGYNLLSGLLIFIIYVCNKNILKSLCKSSEFFEACAAKCGFNLLGDDSTASRYTTMATTY